MNIQKKDVKILSISVTDIHDLYLVQQEIRFNKTFVLTTTFKSIRYKYRISERFHQCHQADVIAIDVVSLTLTTRKRFKFEAF